MKIFITGGTGFIGSRLTEKLAGEDHEIFLLARNPHLLTSKQKKNVHIIAGDILDSVSLVGGMNGCERVFHLASFTRPYSSDHEMPYRINAEGTRNVLEAAMKCRIKRTVIVSTCGTLGFSDDGEPLDENAMSAGGSGTDYDRTKAEAEKIALEFCEKGLDIVIVKPSRVYGPGKLTEANSLTKLIRWYISGYWRILPGDGNAIGNYVFIDDVVSGMILAADYGKKGEKYILGGENLSLTNLLDIIGEASGKKRRLVHIPVFILKIAVKTMSVLSRLNGIPPLITQKWLDKYLRNAAVSTDKAKNDLNYSFTPFREGAAITINWLLSRHK